MLTELGLKDIERRLEEDRIRGGTHVGTFHTDCWLLLEDRRELLEAIRELKEESQKLQKINEWMQSACVSPGEE